MNYDGQSVSELIVCNFGTRWSMTPECPAMCQKGIKSVQTTSNQIRIITPKTQKSQQSLSITDFSVAEATSIWNTYWP